MKYKDPTVITRRKLNLKLGDTVTYIGSEYQSYTVSKFNNTKVVVCKPMYCKKTKTYDSSAFDTICIKLSNGLKIFTYGESISK